MILRLTNIKNALEHGETLNEHTFRTINVYNGILVHCDSFHLYQKYIEPIVPFILAYHTEQTMKPMKDMCRKDVYHNRKQCSFTQSLETYLVDASETCAFEPPVSYYVENIERKEYIA